MMNALFLLIWLHCSPSKTKYRRILYTMRMLSYISVSLYRSLNDTEASENPGKRQCSANGDLTSGHLAHQ